MARQVLLPQNTDAEAAVLGSLLIDPEGIALVADLLSPHDFYHDAHSTIFAAAKNLYEADVPIDLHTLPDALERNGKLEEIGGVSFLISLSNQVPTSANVEYYANIVHFHAVRRRLIQEGADLAALGYSPPEGSNTDDLLARVHDRLSAIEKETRRHASASRFTLLTDDECEMMEPQKGIVGSILYEDSIAFLYAQPGRWKSFLALDWALCIATGRQWLGRPVVEGDSVYVAAEGPRGQGKRIHAWKQHHNIKERTKLKILTAPVQLLDEAQVRDLIAAIEVQCENPKLVVIDTLARSMAGGNENSTQDINAVTDAAYAIKAVFGCCVLIIHHAGKDDTKGLRGSSAIRGNADTILRLAGNETEATIEPGQTISLVSEKSKDGEPFDPISITTEKIQWANDDGSTTNSLVIIASEGTAQSELQALLTKSAQTALDALAYTGKPMKASEWLEHSGLAKRTFYEARDVLEKRRYIARNAATNQYTLTDLGQQQVTPTKSGAEVQNECIRTTDALDIKDCGGADAYIPSQLPHQIMSTVKCTECGSQTYENPIGQLVCRKCVKVASSSAIGPTEGGAA